jgi:DNA-binding LacI/PurR family transcriptional regulator
VYQGISDFFVQYDYKLIFHNFHDLTRSRQPLDLVKSKLVDGLIFVRFSIDIQQFKKEEFPILQKINKPFVVIHSLKEDLGMTSVGLDCVYGGFMATEHLIQHGYPTIGCVTQPGLHCDDLLRGYRQALEQYHLPLREEFIYALAGQTSDEASELAERLLQDKSKLPRALFVVDEYWAYPMIKKFWAAGVRIPQDLAIISFGDVNTEAVALTDMTIVRQPAVEKGYKAGEILRQLLLHPQSAPGSVILKPSLLVNKSCGCVKSSSHGYF